MYSLFAACGVVCAGAIIGSIFGILILIIILVVVVIGLYYVLCKHRHADYTDGKNEYVGMTCLFLCTNLTCFRML